MAKVKTYWDEIKNDETHFSGGNQGWEVRLLWEDDWKYDRKTGKDVKVRKLKLQFPFGPGDGVPRGEKKQCREEVMLKKRLRRKLAMASRDVNEYDDLQSRIRSCSKEEKNMILNSKLKKFNLGEFIRNKYLTDREAHSLFYYM